MFGIRAKRDIPSENVETCLNLSPCGVVPPQSNNHSSWPKHSFSRSHPPHIHFTPHTIITHTTMAHSLVSQAVMQHCQQLRNVWCAVSTTHSTLFTQSLISPSTPQTPIFPHAQFPHIPHTHRLSLTQHPVVVVLTHISLQAHTRDSSDHSHTHCRNLFSSAPSLHTPHTIPSPLSPFSV